MPKEEVVFECILNDSIIKQVTINNHNSQSKVVYLVTLESATKDFEIESDSITLEPG